MFEQKSCFESPSIASFSFSIPSQMYNIPLTYEHASKIQQHMPTTSLALNLGSIKMSNVLHKFDIFIGPTNLRTGCHHRMQDNIFFWVRNYVPKMLPWKSLGEIRATYAETLLFFFISRVILFEMSGGSMGFCCSGRSLFKKRKHSGRTSRTVSNAVHFLYGK